jgi:anti-sigma B factor antagonist
VILHIVEGIELVVRAHPQQPAVSLHGELDLCTAPRILPRLIEAADQADAGLVVDLAGTSFLDCRGLAVLIAVRDALRARDRRLDLRGARGSVRKILAMSELADLLDDRPYQQSPTDLTPPLLTT